MWMRWGYIAVMFPIPGGVGSCHNYYCWWVTSSSIACLQPRKFAYLCTPDSAAGLSVNERVGLPGETPADVEIIALWFG